MPNGSFSLTEIVTGIDQIVIADIGAMCVGDCQPFCIDLLRDGRAKQIAFEPVEEERETLKRRLEGSYEIYPCFVGDGSEQTYYRTNLPMTGSLFKPNAALLEKFNGIAELTELQETHRIKTERLDDVIKNDTVDLIKIDVQGAELQVFSGAERLLEDVIAIQTEVNYIPLYQNQPLFADVDIFLRQRGFMLHKITGFGSRTFRPVYSGGNIYASGSQNMWSDVIYIKDIMRLDTMPPERLLKFSMIMHDIFQSFDLASHILHLVDQRTGTKHLEVYLAKFNQD